MMQIEQAPGAAGKKQINPLLKFALELGPLIVFFFANARGAWIAERIPALADIGGPLFIATLLFMIATALSLTVSYALTRTLPIMPMVSGLVVLVFGTLTLWLQDETFIKMKPTIVNTLFGAILLGGLVFRQVPARLCVQLGLQIRRRGLAQADLPLGPVLSVPRGFKRSRLAQLLDGFLGGVQSLGHDADHPRLHHEPDAADHAAWGGEVMPAARAMSRIACQSRSHFVILGLVPRTQTFFGSTAIPC